MEQSGFYRRYVILEELDQGFGMQHPPEGFVRFEGNRNDLSMTLQIRNLREGTLPYTVILVYSKNGEYGIARVGNLEIAGRNGFMRRTLNDDDLKETGMKPENMRFVLIASEHREKLFIPLAGICSKAYPWDEAVRQRLIRKERRMDPPAGRYDPEIKKVPNREESTGRADDKGAGTGSDGFTDRTRDKFAERPAKQMEKPAEASDKTIGKQFEADNRQVNKVDDVRLEKKLKENFEAIEPFANPRHDYSWYKVNDIAKLSNLLFACNMRIPLFANPKILVGLFKYRHLLAGFYRSDINNMNYFVLGVPSKDDSEGKPFENICRWVAGQNNDFGDMTGYWLVYINLRNGEFVS